MKKKIAILGSTGSIGKSLIRIISQNKKKFQVVLLSAQKNHVKLLKQAKTLRVKNIIITNKKSYQVALNKKIKGIRIYNDFKNFDKIFKSKLDYTMCSITGLEGLEPTLNVIKYTKKIAIANKEAIISGWNLINKSIKKNKTEFIPVDSEHFSIWSLTKNINKNLIDKVYITASGGPFLKWSLNKIRKAKLKTALKHPNWSMGKKISIDSATMMNKVFEVIETQRIFNLSHSQIKILIHEKSYAHAIVKFKNGLNKILVHDADMIIPIFNTIYSNDSNTIKSKDLNIDHLNNLNLKKVDKKKFPLIEILDKIPNHNSLFETILITVNDYLVHKFLENKIDYQNLIKLIDKYSNIKEFRKFKKFEPRNVKEVYNLRDYVSLKMDSLGI